MKSTQFLDAYRNIQRRIVSYLSIMITVIMGVSGLLCIFFISKSINSYASDYYRDHHFKDLEIVSSMGISDDNIRKLSAYEGVRAAEGAFVINGFLQDEDSSTQLTILSATDEVSIPQILEGVMPESENECALSLPVMEKMGLSIGDQVILDPANSHFEKLLKERTFTITGTCLHPDYMDASTNQIALLSKDAFDRSTIADGYLQAFLYLDIDDNVRWIKNASYDSIASSTEKRIREYAVELSRERSEEISSKAWDEYDQKADLAQDQLDNGFKELKDGEQELFRQESEAKTKLSGALDDLTGSELKFSDGLMQILDGEQQYQDGVNQIRDAKAKLASGRAQLDQGYAQYYQLAALQDYFSDLLGGLDLLAPVRAQLAAGEAQYQRGAAELNQKIADADLPGASAKLDESWNQLKQGREKLDNAWLAYEEKKQEADTKIAEGYIKLDSGKAEYEEKKSTAAQKLEDAEEQVKSIEESRFLVINRHTNSPYVGFIAAVDAINGFGYIFIPLFALVAILVIYSTMAIIIDEQKKQVGALKAMGFRSNEIRNKYLIFGISSTLIGVIAGIGLSLVLERIVLQTITSQFAAGDLQVVLDPLLAAVMAGSTLFVAFLVAWFSCRSLLRSTAVGLMNGSEPAKRTLKKSSGRNGSLYSHLIISNIVTELPRVFVSIVVILASCLLIGVAFAMNNAFNKAFNTQNEKIYHYDLQILIDDDADEDTKNQDKIILEEAMQERNISFQPIFYTAASYETENDASGFFLLCGDSTKLKTYVDVSVEIPDSGILVPQKFTEINTFSDAQTMTIYDHKLIPHEVKVSGSYPFYVGYVAVLSPSAYKEIYGEEPDYNGYYCKGDPAEILSLKQELSQTMPSVSFSDESVFSDNYRSTKNLFDIVSLIMVVIAGIMTFMIMINLNSILVNRRMKELLIMKVNGFNNHQIIGYLLRDTMLVNLAGIVIGTAIGVLFNYTLIFKIEPAGVMYFRPPSAFTWGASALMNILFALIINSISFRNVKHIALTDITKY